jgi:ZIP family zinc transporter
VSGTQVTMLGAIAGFTIFLGLPLARVRAAMAGTKATLNAVAIGILLFLFWDILAHAWAPIDGALAGKHLGTALADGAVLAGGLAVGLLTLVWFDQRIARRTANPPTTRTPIVEGAGPTAPPSGVQALWATPGGRLAVLIATGIGLHNFAEGLAIGNSAAAGQLTLAWLLVIGFAAHNATEGFGIIAPLAVEGSRPTWTQLLALGLIGGLPTLLGTLTGQHFSNTITSIAFLALAAGSILYVVIELLAVARKVALKYHTSWGLLAGLALGLATDGILVIAGG